VREHIGDTVVHVDRRALGWDRIEGGDADRAEMQAMLQVMPDATCDVDVLAGLGEVSGRSVSVAVVHWRGHHEAGAPAEIAIGMVLVSQRDTALHIENLDPDDHCALLDRFDQLCDEHLGIRLSPWAPDPVAPATVTRHEGRGGELLAGWADGERFVDAGIDAQGGWIVTPDGEERLPDDPRVILDRVAELRQPAAVRLHRRFVELANARDWDALRETWTDDYVSVDNRNVGWDPIPGAEASIQNFESVVAMAPDIRFESEVIVADEYAVGGRFRASGHAEGGAIEVEMLQVTANRGGRAWRTELFEPDDEERMLARFEELRAEAAAQARPLVVAAREHTIAALNARDWERLHARYTPDAVLLDRRRIADHLASGADAVVEVQRGIVDAVPDVSWSDRVVATHGDLVGVFSAELRGHAPGGGDAEMETIAVIQADRDGRTRRVELFDDEPAARARMRQLGGWTDALERFAATVVARDWDAVRALYVPGARFVDHRSGVRHEGEDAEYLLKLWQTFAEQSPDLATDLHVIDARSRTLAAFRLTLSGHDEHGGAFELVTAQVVEIDDEQRTRQVLVFDPDDTDAIERCLDEIERGTAATRTGTASSPS
jgi:ketosteroid isomerase-like protein